MPNIEILVAGDSDVPIHISDAAHLFLTGQNLPIGFVDPVGVQNGAFAARFQNVPIPRGARIKSAVIRLEANSSQAEVKVNARIDGLLVANSETPTHAEFDGGVVLAVGHGRQINNRTRAQVRWLDIPRVLAGADFDTPDLSLIAQELISLPEWVEGNAMTYFIGDEDHESDQAVDHFRDALRSGVGPRLVVTYETVPDHVRIRLSFGSIPQTMSRLAAAALRRSNPSQVA